MKNIKYLFLLFVLVTGFFTNSALADVTPLGLQIPDDIFEEVIKKPNENATDFASIFEDEEDRIAHEKLFKLALFMQTEVEHELNLPKNDIYAALAIFLYGAWSSTHHGKLIDNKNYAVLIEDTRMLFSATDFDKLYEQLSKVEKQSAYDVYAMTGNWMLMLQLNMKTKPNEEVSQALINIAGAMYKEMGLKLGSVLITDEGRLSFTADVLIENREPEDNKETKPNFEVSTVSIEA